MEEQDAAFERVAVKNFPELQSRLQALQGALTLDDICSICHDPLVSAELLPHLPRLPPSNSRKVLTEYKAHAKDVVFPQSCESHLFHHKCLSRWRTEGCKGIECPLCKTPSIEMGIMISYESLFEVNLEKKDEKMRFDDLPGSPHEAVELKTFVNSPSFSLPETEPLLVAEPIREADLESDTGISEDWELPDEVEVSQEK
jgi:hypothetical protein